jgi:tetratricopeptide (TPR) repeat protein
MRWSNCGDQAANIGFLALCSMRYPWPALAVIATLGACPQGKSQPPQDSGTLHGSVRAPQGRPVAAAPVHLQSKTGGNSLTAYTDSAGNYRFPALREDTYTLRAESIGYSAAAFGPFVLGQKEAKEVDLTLAPAFFDEPNFIAAGVTDAASHGGHGSDAVLRSSEALAKATASLSKESSGNATVVSAEQLRHALEREPANAELHHRLGDADEKLGNSLEAVREYQRAAELDATESNLFDWGAELLTHRAADQAIEVFSKGNRLFPVSVRMLLGLAAAWYPRGAYDQAAQRFYQACDLNPSDPAPYLFLGKVQSVEILQSDGYLERMERFAKLQPDNAMANYYYASGLWKRSGPADSRTRAKVQSLLENAVRLDPNLAAAYLELGIFYAGQKNFPNAIAAYRKAIAVGPQLEEAHYRLAQAYRLTGDELKAQQEFERHAQLSRKSAQDEERERREIQQFVFALRGNSTSQTHQ